MPEAILSLEQLYVLWHALGDVPINNQGALQAPFEHFPAGTHREVVWKWFEASHPRFICGDVLQGIHRMPPTYKEPSHENA